MRRCQSVDDKFRNHGNGINNMNNNSASNNNNGFGFGFGNDIADHNDSSSSSSSGVYSGSRWPKDNQGAGRNGIPSKKQIQNDNGQPQIQTQQHVNGGPPYTPMSVRRQGDGMASNAGHSEVVNIVSPVISKSTITTQPASGAAKKNYSGNVNGLDFEPIPGNLRLNGGGTGISLNPGLNNLLSQSAPNRNATYLNCYGKSAFQGANIVNANMPTAVAISPDSLRGLPNSAQTNNYFAQTSRAAPGDFGFVAGKSEPRGMNPSDFNNVEGTNVIDMTCNRPLHKLTVSGSEEILGYLQTEIDQDDDGGYAESVI